MCRRVEVARPQKHATLEPSRPRRPPPRSPRRCSREACCSAGPPASGRTRSLARWGRARAPSRAAARGPPMDLMGAPPRRAAAGMGILAGRSAAPQRPRRPTAVGPDSDPTPQWLLSALHLSMFEVRLWISLEQTTEWFWGRTAGVDTMSWKEHWRSVKVQGTVTSRPCGTAHSRCCRRRPPITRFPAAAPSAPGARAAATAAP